jgi:signal transduction histidine kinase
MTVLAIGLGWVTAGRVLRPLRSMKTATQQITDRNLHERLALPGPDDEVKDLADTIDGLLARLEMAFEAQRRFVASASHELRTPLTLNRALLEANSRKGSSTPSSPSPPASGAWTVESPSTWPRSPGWPSPRTTRRPNTAGCGWTSASATPPCRATQT